jgi:uncharacterized membrane protein YfcA
MEYGLIGLIVGIIMGLTGAGGALISIPLFLNLLHSSLREATVLSLLAVMLGSFINLFGKFNKIHLKLSFILVLFGGISSYLTLFIKHQVPEFMILLLLTFLGLYSIWSVWSRGAQKPHQERRHELPNGVLCGLLLGMITTLSGLGGGVILVPLLIKIFGKTYEEALPTSLGTIFLISLSSFLLQAETAATLLTLKTFVFLSLGAMGAAFLLKVLLGRMKNIEFLKVREIVFTIVTLYSLISVLWRILPKD